MNLEMESIWTAMKGPYYERILQKLQRGIRQAESLDIALSAALDEVAHAVHAETGTLWFYDRFGDGFIRPKAVYGGSDLKNITLTPGEGVAGQVVASGRSTIVENCQLDPRWAGKVDAATGFRTHSMVCVPLAWREQAFGCIQIINKVDGTEFDEVDLVFVENLASCAAELFREQKLLNAYEDRSMPDARVASAAEPTFSELILLESFSEMAEALLSCQSFARLSETEQKHTLRHMREIWTIFSKSQAVAARQEVRRSSR